MVGPRNLEDDNRLVGEKLQVRTIRHAVFMLLMCGLAWSAQGAKRFEDPRPLEGGLRIVTMSRAGESVAPLGIGSPDRTAMCDVWVTSNYEADAFTTNYLWCDFESLQLIAGFLTPTNRTVRASILIKNSAGTTVINTSGDFPVDQDVVNYVIADIGSLPAGLYKVAAKIQQGGKSVGQSFWFQVTPQSDPLCQPQP